MIDKIMGWFVMYHLSINKLSNIQNSLNNFFLQKSKFKIIKDLNTLVKQVETKTKIY